jgi:queuine tRNA-ribosyltransferase
MFEYRVTKKSQISKARTGVFSTPHGEIKTPVFMAVGTVGAVKTMTSQDLTDVGSQIILANTYHLYLRPGEKLIKKMDGLHNFMKWNKPILTDSGGFQVFSLGAGANKNFKVKQAIKPAKISEEGVKFYSHLDGSEHFISPEKSIEIQEALGADIIMAFDDCPPPDIDKRDLDKSVTRTFRWLDRCIAVKTREDQALFPICQGGTEKALRQESAKKINDLNLYGNAIGGVSVGEQKERIYEVTSWCTDILNENKPRYLMGIGYPEDIAKVVSLGVDMFDCVLPTRLARHGTVWVKSHAKGAKKLHGLDFGYLEIDISKSTHRENLGPIDSTCDCATCKSGLSIAYLRHLISEREPLGIHLLTVHNLHFVNYLVEQITVAIKNNQF